MGYKKDAITGVSWMTAFRGVTRILAFIKIAILARILTPAQFGVFGIASLVLAFLEMLTETGINVILVQSKKELSEFLDSAWVISIFRGIIIALCIIIAAPFIASFFHTPEALGILLFMSAVPFVRGFINPAVVTFQKELAFRSEFLFRTSMFLFDALVSIIVAVMMHSVYSLVWGLLAGALLELILSFIIIKPRPRFVIQKGYFTEIFHKGKWVTAYSVLNYLAQEGHNIIVGKVIGASALGIYQMAHKISILPISEISDVVSRVVFPVYAKISEDKKRLSAAFFKTCCYVSVSAVVLSAIICLFANQIISILLGEQWLAAVPILQILAVYGALRTISGPASALFLSIEKQNYVTVMTFLRFVGLVITIFPLIKMYGLPGAGYSAVISAFVEIPVIAYYLFVVFKKN